MTETFFTLQTGDSCMCQTRECNNPPPQNGGVGCTGIRVRVSNCTVHGGWTAWSAWSACSQTCGNSVKTRRRTCTNPAPAFDGRTCVGPEQEEVLCLGQPPCPGVPETLSRVIKGAWSNWGAWSSCSRSCNGGETTQNSTLFKTEWNIFYKMVNLRQTKSYYNIFANYFEIENSHAL